MIAQELYAFDVDPYKTLSMLVMHDLPEVTHGDIPAFVKDKSPEAHAEHKRREATAAKALYATLPEPARRKSPPYMKNTKPISHSKPALPTP